ncbi:MAG: hypothetical protein QME47_02995 [Candidatus Thermoplasmatota archaeon]|nr:hypothetical protein [Candidatus Thermoplasmatota archaeon]
MVSLIGGYYYFWKQWRATLGLREECYYNYTVCISPPNSENFTLLLPLPVIINITDWSEFIEKPKVDGQLPPFIENLTIYGNATYDVIDTERGKALKVVGNGKVDIFTENYIKHQKKYIVLSMIHKEQGEIFYYIYSNVSFPSPGCKIYIDWWCDVHLQAKGDGYFYPGRITCDIAQYDTWVKGVRIKEAGWNLVTGSCGLMVA